ncbi:YjbQ family protein [Planctomycetales bacterium ZRK34]|nr:YjbQ family protein [Planctomycetales bacterium ZRK34]
MVHQQTLTLKTVRHGQMHDLTGQIAGIVRESEIAVGTVNISNVGSTGSIGCIEYEPGLIDDLPALLDRLIPPSRSYGHEQTWHDGNGHSHLQSTWLGQSLTLPITGGIPNLGTWQQVFHIELDVKPRTRTVVVTVMGE